MFLFEYSLCIPPPPPQNYSLATRTEAFLKFYAETSAWIFLYVIIYDGSDPFLKYYSTVHL